MDPNKKYWLPTYDDVHYMAQVLSTRVAFYPDYIVAVARGGLIPASMIWRHFPEAKFRVVKAKSYKGVFRQEKVRVSSFDWKELKGQKVLFVDDIYDTGKTWEALRGRIPRGTSFDLATTVTKQADPIQRIHAKTCQSDVWVVFPWEKEKV